MRDELPVLLAIDPSVRDLGWAVCNLNEVEGNDYYDIRSGGAWTYGLIQMESTHQIDPSILKYRWREAYFRLKAAMEEEVNAMPTHFASEWPTYFNSPKGRMAAVQNYTLGLASMVGYIAGEFNFIPEHIALWTPAQWKGSVPKHVTKNRFVQTFGQLGKRLSGILSDDVVDAVMIARYWLTLYQRGKFRWQKITNKGELVCP